MKTYRVLKTTLAACLLIGVSSTLARAEATKPGTECFESRDGMSQIIATELDGSWSTNVRCSPTTGGVLWWVDPFYGTIPMGDMPVEADYSHEEAVVKPREPQIDRNKLLTICTTACHDGNYVPYPENKLPRPLKMHTDIVPSSMSLKHGKGAIWCLQGGVCRRRPV